MKQLKGKRIRGTIAVTLITALCFSIALPAAVYAEKDNEKGVTGVFIKSSEELPGYALLPDGTPNPAFTDADGKLFKVSPDEFKEIVADWEECESDKNEAEAGSNEPAPASAAIEGPEETEETITTEMDENEEAEPEEPPAGEEEPDDEADNMPLSAEVTPLLTEIAPLSVDYPYFFHIAGQNDPYGSGHSYKQYYVPAGSDVPQLSFCLEMGKNAPPDSQKVAYTPMGAPDWSTPLATYAPTILNAFNINVETDNLERFWSMQDAVWLLCRSNVGIAANAPVVQQLFSAGHASIGTSNPVFNGITDGGVLKAVAYNSTQVRYGPFSISGMDETATMTITFDSGAVCTSAQLVDAAGKNISLSSVPGNKDLYILMPRNLKETRQINIELNAPFILPSTMDAYMAPSSSYQNQIVMTNWTPRSGTLSINAKLGGYGENEFSKLDSGWQKDYREMDYNGDGNGDIYLLEGAGFRIQEWNGSSFANSSAAVTYDPVSRKYRAAFLAETAANGGRFRIVESTTPYGYRAPASFEFSLKNRFIQNPKHS